MQLNPWGDLRRMPFRSILKIRFGDIDRAGIVYYPRFLHYFHVALEEYFQSELGVEYPVLVNEHHIGLPSVHLETDFFRPLRYGDIIEVEVVVRAVGRSSITFGYRVFKQGETEPRVSGHNVTVCLDMDTFTKKDIPDWLRARLEKR
jgi:4-hydroxybenzoyl-CoA thioesterase